MPPVNAMPAVAAGIGNLVSGALRGGGGGDDAGDALEAQHFWSPRILRENMLSLKRVAGEIGISPLALMGQQVSAGGFSGGGGIKGQSAGRSSAAIAAAMRGLFSSQEATSEKDQAIAGYYRAMESKIRQGMEPTPTANPLNPVIGGVARIAPPVQATRLITPGGRRFETGATSAGEDWQEEYGEVGEWIGGGLRLAHDAGSNIGIALEKRIGPMMRRGKRKMEAHGRRRPKLRYVGGKRQYDLPPIYLERR